jgi:hypothetical protein
MLTTTGNHFFGIEVRDSTVSVLPGTARLGNVLMPFMGAQVTFDGMISYEGDSSKYQNVLLFLENVYGTTDMTKSVSTPKATIRELTLPTLPYDSSNTYSPTFPLSMFTMWSADGTKADLITYTKI